MDWRNASLIVAAAGQLALGLLALLRGRPSPLARPLGPGMDARTAERAFDDFFTTKPSGRGLGLGFVRRVVDAHGGKIELDTRPGFGTTIRLILPAVA